MQNTLSYLPNYIPQRAIWVYLLLLIVCSLFFTAMPFQFIVFGIIEVCGFFYFSSDLSKKWRTISDKFFEKKVFKTALVIRLVWVIFSYFYFIWQTGQPFEYNSADAMWYNDTSNRIVNGTFSFARLFKEMDFNDCGYIIYLFLIKKIFGGWEALLVVRIIKAILGAWMCVLVYRMAKREYGYDVARVAAIFCVLMPNLIYYCGLHLKELEMTFVCVLFLERTDFLLRTNIRKPKEFIIPILCILLMFGLRTVLGVIAIFACLTAVVFSPSKTLKNGRRWIIVLWVLLITYIIAGSALRSEIDRYWNDREQNQEMKIGALEKRTSNAFVKYASGAIMSPLMLTLPMPSMTYGEGKENQMMLGGGNYVKGLLSFFCLMSLFFSIKNIQLRNHLLSISFLISYSFVIVFSGFLFAMRFYMPIIPVFLILCSDGINSIILSKKHNWYSIWLLMYSGLIMAWSFMRIR